MANTYRIYLTDDDRFLLDMYALKFKAGGHDVSIFQNGSTLLNELRTKPVPDALLVDIVMPELDGFDVLEAIKNENLAVTTKKIVLSNQGADSDIEKAKQFLGYDPQYNLRDGLKEAVQWYWLNTNTPCV